MKVLPTKGCLVVRPTMAGEMKMGGLELAGTIKAKIPPQQGTVVRAGEGVRIREGEYVLYGLEKGLEVDGLLVLKESDLVCRIEPRESGKSEGYSG